MMSDLKELVENYAQAKEATQYCLDHEAGRVNMHGIDYLAGEVERLRETVKEAL